MKRNKTTAGTSVLYTRISNDLKKRVVKYAEPRRLTLVSAVEELLESALTATETKKEATL